MKHGQYQNGVTLIEVLVALTILSIGLLAVAMMQLRGLENASAGYLRSQAVILANDMADRLRSAEVNEGADDYVFSMPDNAFECNNISLAGTFTTENDLAEWQNLIGCRLPAGIAHIAESGGVYTIRVEWSSMEEVDADGDTLERVEIAVAP